MQNLKTALKRICILKYFKMHMLFKAVFKYIYIYIYLYIYIYGVHTISFQTSFVWAFKIVVDS